jgi:hypothetical protein
VGDYLGPKAPRLPGDLSAVASGSVDVDQVKNRLHGALHRGSRKASEEELVEVAAVVLAIVGELTAEMAAVIADLHDRVEALEARS